MMEFARYLIPFCTGVLWIGLLAPATLRIFGIPMAIGYWRLDRLNRHLSRRQYVWGYGVFSFGIGMFFLTALLDYLDGPANGGVRAFTAGHVALRLTFWLAVGLFIGSYGAAQLKISKTTVGNKP